MLQTDLFKTSLLAVAATVLFLAAHRDAAAHCDTLDGPVIQDARKAIKARDITAALKWVRPKDEKAVRTAFQKVLSDKSKNPEPARHQFFATLVKIHRAGEGAPFAGLKPAGAVEPALAEADKALASGSADALVQLVTKDVADGIRKRHRKTAAAYQHKDDSVAQGREFVQAYVDYTHYVERLHQDATGTGAPGEHAGPGKGVKKAAGHQEPQHPKH